MKLRLFQINRDLDTNRVKFVGLNALKTLQGSTAIDSEIYDLVYDGTVSAVNLEDVFTIFNSSSPNDFQGHSMSVSDIVEIRQADGIKPGYYFCDTYDFKAVSFHPEMTRDRFHAPCEIELGGTSCFLADEWSVVWNKQTRAGIRNTFSEADKEKVTFLIAKCLNENGEPDGFYLADDGKEFLEYDYFPSRDKVEGDFMDYYSERVIDQMEALADPFRDEQPEKQSTIRVLMVRPGQEAYAVEIGNDLRSMQHTVGGYIEPLYPYADNVALVCNEEGKINGSVLNRAVYDDDGKLADVIAGPFFICGLGEEDFTSLTDEQMERYYNRFRFPEQFSVLNHKLMMYTENEYGEFMRMPIMDLNQATEREGEMEL